jgi:hypothetical protein
MGLGRRKALERLHGLAEQVGEHLEKIAEAPNHEAVRHWGKETANWLGQREAVLDQVGKKSAALSAERIAA